MVLVVLSNSVFVQAETVHKEREHVAYVDGVVADDFEIQIDMDGVVADDLEIPIEHTNDLWLEFEQTNGFNVLVCAPENFTNRVEVYCCTNLALNVWSVAVQDLRPSTIPETWKAVSNFQNCFFRAGNMDIDSDGDGISDARERIVFNTDPLQSNQISNIQSMPLISRDVKAYTSSGINPKANNDSYDDYCWLSAQTYPIWIAYDLSTVDVEQRQRILVRWVTDHWQYFEDVGRAPGDYTIQGSAAPGDSLPDEGTWETLLSVSDNIYHSRQHIVDLGGRNWIRVHVTRVSLGTSLNVNIDVHDAHLGTDDTWFFTGDSLTAHGMQIDSQDSDGSIGPNFAERINELLPAYFPAMENTGRGYWTAADGAAHIPGWLNHFPGRYVPISFGSNDAIGNMSPADFYSYYKQIVDAVLAAGKIPVIPTIAWLRADAASKRLPALNAALAQLKEDYIPEGQTDSLILDGPDLYTLFLANPVFISEDDIHPTAAGYAALRDAWAKKMKGVVYEGEPSPPDQLPPSPPTGLTVATRDEESITLNWTASTDNTAVTGYRVYRSPSTEPTGTSFSPSCTDTGLDADTDYVYTVSAFDRAGNESARSAALAARTAAARADLPRIRINGNHFEVGVSDPSPIFMNGANTPWDRHNGTWNNFGGDYDADWWDTHYRQFNTNGLNSSRVWITCSGEVGININAAGYVSSATQEHWEDLDSFFEIAQKRGVYIMASLISFDHFSSSYTTYQQWRNWINSDANIDSYIDNYLIPFINRYGTNTALWSIDLINEPDWATNTEGGTIAWSRFQQYFAKAAKTIHDRSDVLVTVGISVIKYNSDDTPGSMGNMVSDAALRAQLDDPAVYLDFWSPHWYSWMNPYWDQPMYVSPATFNLDDSKPSLIGECPANGSEGHTLSDDVEAVYLNGWSGLLPWTSNEVDSHGGWEEVSTAGNAFIADPDHKSAVFP